VLCFWGTEICIDVQQCRGRNVSVLTASWEFFKLDVGASLSLPETAGALLTAARGSGPVPLCSAILWQPSKACLTVSSSANLLSGGRASWTFPAARANGDVCMSVWAGTELDYKRTNEYYKTYFPTYLSEDRLRCNLRLWDARSISWSVLSWDCLLMWKHTDWHQGTQQNDMASTQNKVDSVQEMKQGFTLLKRQA